MKQNFIQQYITEAMEVLVMLWDLFSGKIRGFFDIQEVTRKE